MSTARRLREKGWSLVLTTILAGGALVSLALAEPPPLKTVPFVDLNRYVGTWHEMARYPNDFQDANCLNVTAQYTLDEDGDIDVVNTCHDAQGRVTETADGTATIEDKTSQAKLSVTFFWPFSGDYWIVALADDYSWVIVSEPDREYLWILTRQPIGAGAERDALVAKAASLGFDTSKLFFSQRQPAGADPS